MSDRTFGSQLGQMALALINATLMLAVLVVFGLWLLLGRAQDFATDTARAAADAIGSDLAEGMTARAAGLEASIASLASLEGRLDAAIARAGTADGPAVAELAALRTDVQGLTAAVGQLAAAAAAFNDQPADAVSGLLHQILQGLAARLAPPQPSPT